MTDESNRRWTVLKLIQWTSEYLTQGDVPDGRLSGEILLSHVLGCGRIDLYTRFDYEPTDEQLKCFRELVARAHARHPVAYLVGEKEFYSLPIKVTPDVLIPRPETELLVEVGIGYLRTLNRPGTVWDVCTGSGCIAVAIATNIPDATVLGTDVSEKAIEIARANASAHHLEHRVRFRVADLLSLPADCEDLHQFDVITANPPYVRDTDEVAEEVAHEPQLGLRGGPDGLDHIRPIIRDAPRVLKPGGLFVMEFGTDQGDDVWDLITRTDQFTEPKILKDHRAVDRAVAARKRIGDP